MNFEFKLKVEQKTMFTIFRSFFWLQYFDNVSLILMVQLTKYGHRHCKTKNLADSYN